MNLLLTLFSLLLFLIVVVRNHSLMHEEFLTASVERSNMHVVGEQCYVLVPPSPNDAIHF